MLKLNIIYIFVLIYVTACSAVGVPYTSDPYKKLQQATSLYQQYNRPLPAQRLIFEAMETFENNKDELGIAKSYRTYAFFLQSDAVGKFEPLYRKQGFYDKSVSFDNRYIKAIEYFRKTVTIYKKHSLFDELSNIYMSMANNYAIAQNNNEKACHYLGLTLETHSLFMKNNPGASVVGHPDYSSFSEYINTLKKEYKCK